MTSKTTIACAALLAAFALSAVAAPQASATTHSFYTEVAPTHLTAEAKTAQELIATPVDETYVKCGALSASGTIESTKVSSVTVTPAYSECGIYEGETKLAVTFVAMESCHYVFGGETVESKLGSHAAVEIECDVPGDHIEVKATAFKLSCISVPAQNVSGIRYEDGETGGVDDISIEATTTGLDTTTTPSLACPTESGKTETHDNGTLIGKTTLKGHDSTKNPAGVSTTQLPLRATHHITANEAWKPTASAIDTQELRATTGEANANHKCKKVSMTTTGDIGTTVDEVAVTPKYEECEAEKEGTKVFAYVETGECEYVFKGKTTEGNPTGGEHANVEIRNHLNPANPCTIDLKVTNFKIKCISVPNQIIEHAVSYEQNGNHIALNFRAHGIENTTTNSVACPTESGQTEVHDNGSYTGKVTVAGSNAGGGAVPLTLNQKATP